MQLSRPVESSVFTVTAIARARNICLGYRGLLPHIYSIAGRVLEQDTIKLSPNDLE
jgi:hypothetical protein